jgi:hypothetical protein
MAQVVEVDLEQACPGERGQPHAAAEVAAPQPLPARADEDRAVIAGLGVPVQVVAEAGSDQWRELDRAPTGRGLWQAREKRSAVGLGQRGDHPHSAGIEVNVLAGERGQLAPPEAGEGC